MKRNQEKLKEEFLAEAEELFDRLMEWEGENDRPNLTQIEDIVLELRKRFGEQLAEKVMMRQEQPQPAERVACPKCGDEMRPKGLKVGCVFEIGSRIEPDPQTKEVVQLGSAVNNSYVAHLGGPETFGHQIWAEARQRSWMQAEDSLAIGDGAAWIWNLVSEHFYASEHLAEAARVRYGEGAVKHRTWLSSSIWVRLANW